MKKNINGGWCQADQKVEGNLYTANQIVEGELIPLNEEEIASLDLPIKFKRILWKNNQKVKGDIK